MYSSVRTKEELIKLQEFDTIIQTHSVFIDSRDRNRDKYPSSNEFTVRFNGSGNDDDAIIEETYRNIHSIELTQCVLPNLVLGATGHMYITLEIDEINDNFQGTNDTLSDAFAYILPRDIYGTRLQDKHKRVFKTPKASLGKLSFKFRQPNGSLVNFGIDSTPPTDPNDDLQVLMVFKISTIVKKPKGPVQLT